MICLEESTVIKRLDNRGQENKQAFDHKKKNNWNAFPTHTRGENINTF